MKKFILLQFLILAVVTNTFAKQNLQTELLSAQNNYQNILKIVQLNKNKLNDAQVSYDDSKLNLEKANKKFHLNSINLEKTKNELALSESKLKEAKNWLDVVWQNSHKN
jgi:hypothetical protein